MITSEKEHNHFFTGLLIGGIVGGLASLLLAPISGKELGADIKETREKAKRILCGIKEKGDSAPRYAEPVEESVGEA